MKGNPFFSNVTQSAVDAQRLWHALISWRTRVGKNPSPTFLPLFCTILGGFQTVYISVTFCVCLQVPERPMPSKNLSCSWNPGSNSGKPRLRAKSPYKESSCTSLCPGPCISWCLDTYRSLPLNKEACQPGASGNPEIIQTVRHRLIKTSSPFTALVLH